MKNRILTVALRLSLRLAAAALAGVVAFILAFHTVMAYELRLVQTIRSGMRRADVERTLYRWKPRDDEPNKPKEARYMLCYSGAWYNAHVAYDASDRVVGSFYED